MEKQIRTTLILRNDTSANWAASSLVLKKGEVGFDTDLHIFKVGDGTKIWSQIEPYFVDFAAVEEAINDATKNLHTTDVYQKEIALGGDKAAALAEITSPVKGDIAIIKEALQGGKYQYTAYVRGETNWEAMDGNYDAGNVYFKDDITATTAFGIYAPDASGSVVLPASGKSVEEFLKGALAEANNTPKVTQPSVSISLTGAGAKEVGSEFTPSYTVSFNKGSYQYGPDTGITATYEVSDTDSHTATTATGSFVKFTVGDSTNYKVSVVATHTAGADPKNNLGATEGVVGKIAAGTKRASSNAVTGYRNSFWGGVNSKEGTPTSAIIRGLAGKQGGAISAGNTGDAQEKVGDMRVIIAVPAPRTISSIKDVNGLNAEAFSAFTHITVNVEGANGYEAKSYNVYYKDNAAACDKANKWHFTVA